MVVGCDVQNDGPVDAGFVELADRAGNGAVGIGTHVGDGGKLCQRARGECIRETMGVEIDDHWAFSFF